MIVNVISIADFCLNALESGRLIVTEENKKKNNSSVLSQCPGKRAAHCYTNRIPKRDGDESCLNALESGRLIVTRQLLL